MGQSPSHPTNHDLFSTYQQLKQTSQGLILQHRHTQLTYLLKEYTHSSDSLYEHQRNQLEQQCDHNQCEFILGVHKVKTHSLQGLCSNTHKLYVMYEYPMVNLQDEIIARGREQGKRFDENQLWSIMQSCTTALGFLRKTASLNSELVFITQDGQLKVIHNDLINENYRYSYNQQYLYAPEKLKNFNQMDHEDNLVKEAVFSMGMTVLQAALLTESVNCYDHQRQLFLEVNLELMLQDLEGVYSKEFGKMLKLMLKVEPKERPTLGEIEGLLDGYWNCDEEGEGESVTLGMSKRCLTGSEEKGIIKNLVTINSHQKESVIRETSKPCSSSSNSKGISVNMNKISQSIECSVPCRPTPSSQAEKENQYLYTDPKLLQMIRQDLQDINKLKQSTLKETIKYSFLYPESDSIFKSVQDVKLVRQSVQLGQGARKMQPLEESDGNQSIPNQCFGKEQREEREHGEEREYGEQREQREEREERQQRQQRQQTEDARENGLQYCKTIDSEGHEYEGEMLHGKKHGRGKLLFEDGAFYEGQFEDDQINGTGILFYCQNKPAYDGMWLNGQFHGQGTLYNECPQQLVQPFDFKDFDEVEDYWLKYSGEFYEDSKCGAGRLELTNGQLIEGTFENDLINGSCTFQSSFGPNIRGKWEMNQLIHIYEYNDVLM